MANNRVPVAIRYSTNVDRRGADECWPWVGGIFRDGRGQISHQGKTKLAVRVGYLLTFGEDPGDLKVCHTCDHPWCHNPTHWFLGTYADNNRDRHAKGRSVLPNNRGQRHGMSKLTDEQVLSIRSDYATGQVLQSELAVKYGVRQQQISRIVRGISWGHSSNHSSSEASSSPRRS